MLGASVATIDAGEPATVVAESQRGRRIDVGGSQVQIELKPRVRRWLGQLGGHVPSRDLKVRNGQYDGWRLGYAESQLTFRDWSHFYSWTGISPSFRQHFGGDGVLLQVAVLPQQRNVRVDLYRVRIGDALAAWSCADVRTVGRLVPMEPPPEVKDFHDAPPTLEGMKWWVEKDVPVYPFP